MRHRRRDGRTLDGWSSASAPRGAGSRGTYSARVPSRRRSSGHAQKGRERLIVAPSAQSSEKRGDRGGILDCHVRLLLQVALEKAGGNAPAPCRLLPADESREKKELPE